MAEYYFSAQMDNGATLCIAPLTDRRIELSGEEIADTSGYFLYSIGDDLGRDVQILASIPSEEAAWQLKEMLKLD